MSRRSVRHHPEAALQLLLLTVQRGFSSLHFIDQLVDPLNCRRVHHPQRERLVMGNFLVEFHALVTHESPAFARWQAPVYETPGAQNRSTANPNSWVI